MAAFTISQDRNFHDAFFASRTGGDTYIIQAGKTLTIDCDVRYGPNTSPTTGPIAGGDNEGTILVDATRLRGLLITGTSGTVPAAGTVITQASTGATGILVGVWVAAGFYTQPPLAAGSAMPSLAAVIKLRQVSGSFAVSGTNLSGIGGAPSYQTDFAATLEIAGDVGTGFTCPGSFAKWQVRGTWFEITTTTGAAQSFSAPAHVTNTFWPGVWIEKSVGSNTFECWPAVGLLNDAPTDARGKVSFIDASGSIRIGNNGTKAAGYVPVAGLRIVVPNVIFTNTSSANRAANLAVAPNGTKFVFVTTGFSQFGDVDVEYAVFNTKLCAVTCSAFRAYRCGFTDVASIGGALSLATMQDCGLGSTGNATFPSVSTIEANNNSAGLVINNCQLYAQRVTGSTVFGIFAPAAYVGLTVTGSRFIIGERVSGSGQYAVSFYSGGAASGVSFDNVEVIGGAINCGAAFGATYKNIKYADKFLGTQDGTFPVTALLQVGQNCLVDGLSWLIATADTCHPPNYLVQHKGELRMRNIGTQAAPLNLGTVNGTWAVLQDGGSARKYVKLNKVYTTASRSGTPIQNYLNPSYFYNCQFESTGAYSFQVAAMTAKNCRSTGSAWGGYSVPGLQFLDQFLSDTTGEIVFYGAVYLGNPDFASVMTLSSGAYMDGSGIVYIPAGGVITYETPWFIKGHTGFQNVTQFAVYGGTQPSGCTIVYDIDKGSGYRGSWTTCNGANMSAETGIDPAVGFKLKVRVTGTTGTNYRPARIATTSTLTAQGAYQWPLDPVNIVVNSLATGSIVKVTRTDTGTVLFTGSESGGQVNFSADYTGQILVEARKASGTPYYQPWTALATVSGDTTITAVQVRDDQ